MINRLEDKLLKLKFDIQDGYDIGVIESIKFCLRKHREGWTIQMFNKELESALKLNLRDEYIQGIVAGMRYNIKVMEETNERK